MHCQACKKKFSPEIMHQPRVLINCGHSQCQSCICESLNTKNNNKKQIKCQQCGKTTQGYTLQQYPLNATLISILESNTKLNSNGNSKNLLLQQLCSEHGQKLQAYCQNDSKLLCVTCILNNNHTSSNKPHKISSISQKVSKDRLILRQSSQNIARSFQQISSQLTLSTQLSLRQQQDYKDQLLELGLFFKHLMSMIKEIQVKCQESIKKQFELSLNKIELNIKQLKEKEKFYQQLAVMYDEVSQLRDIHYLNEDTKRVFIMENCKYQPQNKKNKEKGQSIHNYHKINTYTQIINTIQQLLVYEKKLQSQGTPTLKSKKIASNKTSNHNREPTVLQVNLNEQYRKFMKGTCINQADNNIINNSNNNNNNNQNRYQVPNSSNNIQNPINNKLSRSLKTPRLNKQKTTITNNNKQNQNKFNHKYNKTNNDSEQSSAKKHKQSTYQYRQQQSKYPQNHEQSLSINSQEISVIQMANQYMVNSNISNVMMIDSIQKRQQFKDNNDNSFLSFSIKGTDNQFTMFSTEQRIFHFGSFNVGTIETIKIQYENNGNLTLSNGKNNKDHVNRSKSQCILLKQQNLCLILGGKSLEADQKLNTVLLYNFITNQLSQTQLLVSQPKSGFGCIIKGNKIYIAGGSNQKKSLRSFQQYTININNSDHISLNMMSYPNMFYSRDELGMVLGYDGYIYICGGINQSGVVLNSFQRFNFQKHKWQLLPNMNKPRRCFSLVAMPHGIYAIGGYDGSQYLNQVQLFDFTLNRWVSVCKMFTPRFAHSAVVTNDMQNIIVSGGFNKKPLKSCEVYNVIEGNWRVGVDMEQERFLHCSVIANI